MRRVTVFWFHGNNVQAPELMRLTGDFIVKCKRLYYIKPCFSNRDFPMFAFLFPPLKRNFPKNGNFIYVHISHADIVQRPEGNKKLFIRCSSKIVQQCHLAPFSSGMPLHHPERISRIAMLMLVCQPARNGRAILAKRAFSRFGASRDDATVWHEGPSRYLTDRS